MVVPHYILIGVPQSDDDAAGLAVIAPRRQGRRRQAGAPVGVVAQGHSCQTRPGGKAPFQPVAQIAGEQQPVEGGTAGELLRQPAYRAIGPVGIEKEVIRIGQLAGQLG